ncbi:MAG: dephospho-CoA kinase [Candidatus Aminicenantes bacterium]|nr:dephospho-CoA kinase [Candidatus Aminicenantes bacterium]
MAGAKLCIGLTGRMASGKGEVVRILNGYGFHYISLSDIVRSEAAKVDPRVNRSQMQDIGNRLRREGGAGVLGRMVRERIAAAAEKRWVIDGIRNPAEVLELKKLDVFFLIGIESSMQNIMARLKDRGRVTDLAAEKELWASLEREWGIGEPAGGQQVGPCLSMADFIVANNGTLAEFKTRLDEVLKKTGAGHA